MRVVPQMLRQVPGQPRIYVMQVCGALNRSVTLSSLPFGSTERPPRVAVGWDSEFKFGNGLKVMNQI